MPEGMDTYGRCNDHHALDGRTITTLNIMVKRDYSKFNMPDLATNFVFFKISGVVESSLNKEARYQGLSQNHKSIVFFSGVSVLVLVPVFKTVTHLPPYMGILFGLGILWVITEVIHGKKDVPTKHTLSVAQALRKIDMPSILFFLGILICIAALQSTGILTTAANWMNATIRNINAIAISIGLLSAIVDNVPLVAATQGMYSLTVYRRPFFWEFLAFAAGTGGSVLIIGSAAGVAAMGMEKINFFWYLRKISLPALIGYLAVVCIHFAKLFLGL